MKFLIYISFFLFSFTGVEDKPMDWTDPTLPTIELTELKAFPTGKGFGKGATGGRGGDIYVVSNTNNSGTGSLRAALEASGTRYIVFGVGGTITLSGGVFITDPNFTLDASSAPGDGVLIKLSAGEFRVTASNAIIRNLRFRYDQSSGGTYDAFRIVNDTGSTIEDVIVDHCSMSWATDENISLAVVTNNQAVQDITIQNCIAAESGYGTLLTHRIYDASFINNYYAHNTDRNLRVGGYDDRTELRIALKAEFINNIAFGMRYASNITYGHKYSASGNVYKLSNAITTLADGAIFKFTTSGEYTGYRSRTELYEDDNILIGSGSLKDGNISAYEVGTPFNDSGYSATAASTLASILFDNVGAYPHDAIDTRVINNYADGSGSVSATKTFPTMSSVSAPTDTDGDGIPDTFETEHGLNPAVADDDGVTTNWVFDGLANVTNTAGFTNIEMYNFSFYDIDRMVDGTETPNGWTLTPAVGGATCSDGIQNGDETGVDCGGSCSACEAPGSSLTPKSFRIGTSNSPFFYLGSTKYHL